MVTLKDAPIELRRQLAAVLLRVERSRACRWGKAHGLWRGFINVHGGGAYREGRKPDGSRDGHGNKASFAEAQQLLRVDWMTQLGMNESAPWAYTERIGTQLIEHLRTQEAA